MTLLVEDFDRGGVIKNLHASPRWDEGLALTPECLARIDDQYRPGLNIVDQLQDDEARAHVFRVLAVATPDKRLLGTAAFLLWISGQRDEQAGDTTESLPIRTVGQERPLASRRIAFHGSLRQFVIQTPAVLRSCRRFTSRPLPEAVKSPGSVQGGAPTRLGAA